MGKRSRKNKKAKSTTVAILTIAIRIVAVVMLAAILYKATGVAYDFGHSIFYEEGLEAAPGRDVTVTIPVDTTVGEAADILKNNGLIENKLSFTVQAKFFSLTINPGEYTFNTSQSTRQMLEIMNEGAQENDS